MHVLTLTAVTSIALAAVPVSVRAQSRPNEQVVLDFFAAWSRLDAAEIAGYFTEDGIYHNMPSPEGVQGRGPRPRPAAHAGSAREEQRAPSRPDRGAE
jgi:ketosteroid isomerase-like protein